MAIFNINESSLNKYLLIEQRLTPEEKREKKQVKKDLKSVTKLHKYAIKHGIDPLGVTDEINAIRNKFDKKNPGFRSRINNTDDDFIAKVEKYYPKKI